MRTTRTEIARHWLGDLHSDMGEAMCWACHRWDGSEESGAYDAADWLERCHLIPASLGGADAPENLVLLCETCHREMPNVTDRESALAWVRSYLPRFVERLHAEVSRICPDALERLQRADSQEFAQARERRADEAIVRWGEGSLNEATFAWIYARALQDVT